jgi:hypothetical protein
MLIISSPPAADVTRLVAEIRGEAPPTEPFADAVRDERPAS